MPSEGIVHNFLCLVGMVVKYVGVKRGYIQGVWDAISKVWGAIFQCEECYILCQQLIS